MSNSSSARIHPTAVISVQAELADDIDVGPHVVLEGPVRIGPGCVLRAHAHLIGPLTLGRDNQVFGGAVLGERPQHLRYNGEPTTLEIGDANIFREHVTVHRGTAHTGTTRIGSGNFFMVNSHVAHDCRIGNRCIVANGALVAGHCVLDDSAYLSGNSAIHQFVRIGRLALVSGCSATSKDIPPFLIAQGINRVVGVNVVGMRRAGLGAEQVAAVRRAYRILFLDGNLLPISLAKVERELGTVPVIGEMLAFIRTSNRGINLVGDRDRGAEAA